MSASYRLVSLDYPVYKQATFDPNQASEVPYLFLTVLFIVLMYALETYLDYRQLSKLLNSPVLPKELSSYVSDEKFVKSNSYSSDKFVFKLCESFFGFCETVLFILLGYLPYAWDLSTQVVHHFGVSSSNNNSSYSDLFEEICITWVFILLLTLLDTAINLPFSLYSTFVVEQRHGFNKSTLALFFQDKAMTLGLTVVLGMPIFSLVIWWGLCM